MDKPKRFVQVGIGGRGWMYVEALSQAHAAHGELVAMCDPNPIRMTYCARQFFKDTLPAMYPPEQFDDMLRAHRPDTVIVSSVDATHADYICRAMEAGCDVISEKPMTTTGDDTRRVLRTIEKTGRNVTVGFNLRYMPQNEAIKTFLLSGAVGEPLNASMTWKLSIRHGADYFRRWHRERQSSGSLLIHKASHHFDLVNWFLDDVPESVFAHGSLRFYRPETADRMGLKGRSNRCLDCPRKADCRFYFDLNASEFLREMYLKAESEDGYHRDRCVFAPAIDIWDSMSLTVRYRRGAILSYMLHAFSPFEGFHLQLNGADGRFEYISGESGIVLGMPPGSAEAANRAATFQPLFGEVEPIPLKSASGGHGGADPRLTMDLFSPAPQPDPLGRRADALAGAYAVLIGDAAAESIDKGQPVRIRTA